MLTIDLKGKTDDL